MKNKHKLTRGLLLASSGIRRRQFLWAAGLISGTAFFRGRRGLSSMMFGATDANAIEAAGATVVFVEPNAVPPDIVIGAFATVAEKFAAQELAEYLTKITGQTLAIVDDSHVPGSKRIAVGRSRLTASFDVAALDRDQSIVDVTPNQVSIVGGRRAASPGHAARDAGTLYGVYELLESLGVRWYRPEEWGEHVPKLENIELPLGRTTTPRPAFATRAMMSGGFTYYREQTAQDRQIARQWCARNRINDTYTTAEFAEPYGGLEWQAAGRHNWPSMIPASEYFDTHPEYFALVGGKRVPTDLCPGNTDVQKLYAQKLIAQAQADSSLASLSAEPGDGKGGTCQCSLCTALDQPKNTRLGGEWSNRVSTFGNNVAAMVAKEVPWLKVQWLGYSGHTAAPTCLAQLEPNTQIMMCPINGWDDWRKRLLDDSNPQNHLFVSTVRDWAALKPSSLMTFLYFNGYGWAGPLPIARMVADRMRNYRDLGIKANYLPGCISWGPASMDWYITARLFWNPDLDVDSELALYYTNYYGPASGPMKIYHELLMDALETGPQSIFSGGRGMYSLMTPELIAKLGEQMTAAQAAAKGQPIYERRLAGVAAGYEYSRRVCAISELKKAKQDDLAEKAFQDFRQYVTSFSHGDAVFDVSSKDANSEKPISGPMSYIVGDLGVTWKA